MRFISLIFAETLRRCLNSRSIGLLFEQLPRDGASVNAWKIICDTYILWHLILVYSFWASTRENLSSEVCEQYRHRPACAYAQSDQRLCNLPLGKYHMQTSYRWNFNFLASHCSWGDWFETHFVGYPEDRFCRNEAHLSRYYFYGYSSKRRLTRSETKQEARHGQNLSPFEPWHVISNNVALWLV